MWSILELINLLHIQSFLFASDYILFSLIWSDVLLCNQLKVGMVTVSWAQPLQSFLTSASHFEQCLVTSVLKVFCDYTLNFKTQ